jgi:two-component system, LytTR family, response regulator
MLTCIAVEDEPLALERLAGHIANHPSLRLLGAFDRALSALEFLRSNPVDIVFLDIDLGGLSGIEWAESGTIASRIIFTTAHQQHAARAFDLKAADYLLKPFSFQRFVQAVDRVAASINPPGTGTGSASTEPPRIVFVKTEHRLERVSVPQILYIEGLGDYRLIRTAQKRIMTLETFGDLEARLAPAGLCRVHRSYMVAIDRIESIERDEIRIADMLIPISRTYRDAFYARIKRKP